MKSRIFVGKFFTDPYVQDLNIQEKLAYIYYLYNERVNWLGTYEVSDKTALFEIGDLKQDTLQKIKARFQADGKILFVHNFVILKNSEKYENHLGNKQLMKTALLQFKTLPEVVKTAFLSFKPSEVVTSYSSTFAEFGYVIPSSLLVGYSYPTSSQPVDEVISNKNKEIRNKKEEVSNNNKYTEIISHFNQTFEKQTKSYASWKTNCDLHLKSYSLEDIKQAITNWKQHGDKFWAKEPSLDLLFRTKNKNGQPCDYIDQLLNLKSTRKLEADPLAGLVRKGNYVGN